MTYARQLKYLDLILKNNKVPHAFLFYGPDARSQKSIAQAVVFLMNQPGASWADFESGDSQLAYQIKSESQPDIFAVKKLEDKKAVGIGQIRGLKNFVACSPLSLKTKAVIIEDAEILTEESWNALLKTLEEPSRETVIFLLSSGLKAIPKTIISRVLSLSFQASSDGTVGASGTASKLEPKDDIIISKLSGLDKLSVLERFDLAEELATRENKLEILDGWLLVLRSQILTGQPDSAARAEAVAGARNILAATNANPRLVLENLFLSF